MTAPLNLNRAAGLFAALLLGAAPAFPSAARDGTLTVAQNPPDPAPPAQGEENPKEHKKDRGDKGQQQQQEQQKGPQGAAPD